MGASKSPESQLVNERRWKRRQNEHIRSMKKELVYAQDDLMSVLGGH